MTMKGSRKPITSALYSFFGCCYFFVIWYAIWDFTFHFDHWLIVKAAKLGVVAAMVGIFGLIRESILTKSNGMPSFGMRWRLFIIGVLWSMLTIWLFEEVVFRQHGLLADNLCEMAIPCSVLCVSIIAPKHTLSGCATGTIIGTGLWAAGVRDGGIWPYLSFELSPLIGVIFGFFGFVSAYPAPERLRIAQFFSAGIAFLFNELWPEVFGYRYMSQCIMMILLVWLTPIALLWLWRKIRGFEKDTTFQ